MIINKYYNNYLLKPILLIITIIVEKLFLPNKPVSRERMYKSVRE